MKVGLVGLGSMGSNIARVLLEAKHEVFALDIDGEKVKVAVALGAKAAATPKESAQATDVSLLSLPMPQDVESVVCGEEGILAGAKRGHIIVDMSTVDPFSTRKNTEIASKSGVGYIDAPVLGRPQACGRWTLPVGGEKNDLEKARRPLEAVAAKIIYVGPSGSGNIVKLLNNMMFGAINMITVEILALSAKLGMDSRMLFETIADSGAATVSGLFKELGPKILTHDFSPLFSIDLLHKDVTLAIDMAKKAGVPVFIAPAAQTLNEMAQAKGLGKEDTSAVVKVYEDIFGVQV